jgi:hypothetical protein
MALPGTWMMYFDWTCDGGYGSTPMTVNANGTWTSGEGYSGVWVQAAGMVIFDFSTGTIYTGNVASQSITGIQRAADGAVGCFYMLQAGAPTAADETRRAKGKADVSGKK